MEDFKLRQNEYFNKLRSNPEFVKKIMDGTKDKKSLEILLIPKDEKELEVAESMYNLMYDMVSIIEKSFYDELNHIDVENSSIFNLFVNIINSLKNNDENRIEEIKDYLNKKIDIKSAAKLVYELLVIFSQNPEDTISKIAEKCGFNINDDLDIMQFQLYFKKANEITNASNNSLNLESINIDNNEQLSQSIEFSKEFHRLYVEGISKNPEIIL